ncbi:hypothetical protein [Taibaiella koreensis]|uniref:hypothetical protein n=1 Tax=Taibaiella koreensis TaxID=1268548 RepID=UPI001968A6EA|nr:hypothetical protein [Taibaiella koreensis]
MHVYKYQLARVALPVFLLVSISSSFLFASMFIVCYGAHEKSCSAKKEAKKAAKKQCSAVFLWPAHPGLKIDMSFNATLPGIGSWINGLIIDPKDHFFIAPIFSWFPISG